MSSRPTTIEQRQLLATARSYRRAGYRVSTSAQRETIPPFLDGIVPDLVAERDDDHVVIAIKRADAVAGSNDILALAQKVSSQAGWRFELISVSSPGHISVPDMSVIREEADRLIAQGFTKPAFLVFFSAIETMISFAAVRAGFNPANSIIAKVARELVIRGIISSETYEDLGNLSALRDAIAHGYEAESPSRHDIDALFALGRCLQDEILAPAMADAH